MIVSKGKKAFYKNMQILIAGIATLLSDSKI